MSHQPNYIEKEIYAEAHAQLYGSLDRAIGAAGEEL
jgi:hypothetical protein